MKRFHVHLNVDNLEDSIGFYRMLFGVEPSVIESDYAKWMLDDPRLNFAISQRGRAAGIDHLGLQADDEAGLAALGARLRDADAVTLAEEGTVCCYARSDKLWAEDPQGVRWETFRTLGASTSCAGSESAPCCGPPATGTTGEACC